MIERYRNSYTLLHGFIDMLLYLPTNELRGTPMIEIGSNIGESTRIFSMIFSPVYSIDPLYDENVKGTLLHVHDLFHENTAGRNVVQIRKRSQEAANDPRLPAKVKMIYIDGDHSFDAVISDVKMYWPRLEEGGWLCGHDYNSPSPKNTRVKDAIDKLFGKPDAVFMDMSFCIKKTKERMVV